MLSTTSGTSSHPLRQTSFPPEIKQSFSRSPSMDTMSVISGAGTNNLTKTGRERKKYKKKTKDNSDLASILGRKAKSTISNDGAHAGEKRKRRGSNATEEGDEDEELGGEEMSLNINAASKEERAKEERKKQVLVRAFEGNGDQFSRYEAWRSSKLSDATVRRVSSRSSAWRTKLTRCVDCQPNTLSIRSAKRYPCHQISSQNLRGRND